MPRVVEIKEIDGAIWARLEMNAEEGQVTMWTQAEIEEHRLMSAKEFLQFLFFEWKDRA